MTFFEQFFSNTIFLTAAFGWLVAQILKTLIHLIVSKKFVAERLVGSGGMPSSHSATSMCPGNSGLLRMKTLNRICGSLLGVGCLCVLPMGLLCGLIL